MARLTNYLLTNPLSFPIRSKYLTMIYLTLPYLTYEGTGIFTARNIKAPAQDKEAL